jgi:hypothetical protein
MSIRLTGLPQIATGAWELYKARKALMEGNLSEEDSTSRQRFNRTKVGIGALKLALIGYSASNVVYPLLNNETLSNTDIGILATFAAGYAVLSIHDIYSSFLTDEAVNYKYNQSILENNFKIKLTDNNIFEMTASESYQLFMFGNKLATGNPVDSFIFKIKEKINNWKLNFNIEDNKDFGIIRKNIYKTLKLIGVDKLMDSIYSNAKIKKEAFEIIKSFTDIKSPVNKEFMEYLKKDHTGVFSNEDDIKSKLKDINQEAIIKTYQKMLTQNIQLFFSKFVIDYLNGNKNEDLLLKFLKLKDQNTLKSNNTIIIEEYSKISKISSMLLNKEKNIIKDRFKTNLDVLKYLESNLLDKNNKIKFLDFGNMFKLERKEIINKKNGLSKINKNIYEDKKGCFTEINFDKNIISKTKINQAKLRDKITNQNLKNE